MKQKIILATNSPRRHELASVMGLDFEVVPSSYEEQIDTALPPKEMVMEFAYGKAADVAKKFKAGIVIGIDTIVVFNNTKLGKPKDKKHAFEMLKSFSNKEQEVYSGIAIINCSTGKVIKDFEITKVWFGRMKDDEIKRYVATGEPLDKAGAYGIQDLSAIFIRKIEGCYFNIVGFPIYTKRHSFV